jgi:hypothetical protein
MAEAGRESSQQIRSEQLSLLHHREEDYTSALARPLLGRPAHSFGTSNERFPESTTAGSSSQKSIARKRRVADATS